MPTKLEQQLEQLAGPVSPDQPCGVSLEGTPELAAFDSYRLFGLLVSPQDEPDWRVLRNRSLAALERSLEQATGKAAASGGGDLAELSRDELYERAQDDDIPGRSSMSKDELVKALSRR